MRFVQVFCSAILAIGLAGCASGNVKTASAYHAPPAPPVHHPYFTPFAAYGSTNATSAPPVFNRWGTIVKPRDPTTGWTRPDYEAAPWSIGAKPSPYGGPAGTF